MTLTLRPYQEAGLSAIEAAAARGIRRQLLALPTGTGKTVLFVELVRRRASRALVLVHRDELVRQTVEKLALVGLNHGAVGIVKAEQDESDRRVVVASVQTISRPNRLARIAPNFSTVVVDECHHATAESYRRVLEHVGAFTDDGPLVLGVTATAERADGEALGEVFEEIVYEARLLDMIRTGYLADLRAVQVRLAVDFHQLHTRAGDFIESELEDVLLKADAPRHIATAYAEHAPGRKGLVFTPTVHLTHRVAEAFRAIGVAAEALDAGTPLDDRRAILARLRSGQTRVVSNCAVLTEGFDEPSIDAIFIARPTKSRPLFVQMIGGGTRRHPGKVDCLVVDTVGATTRHDLVTAATLFGVPPGGLLEISVLDAVDAVQLAAEQAEQRGRLVARAVDLFRARPLHWVAAGPGRFALAVGEAGLLLLIALPDARWAVRQRTRDRREITLQAGLDLGYAQGWAEDHARRLGAGRLIDRAAAWRREPATVKQRETLTRCRVPIPRALTKGEAADLLTAAFARPGRSA